MPRKISGKEAYDFQNENFNTYVQEIFDTMTPPQKALLPFDISGKAYKKSDGFKVDRLTFPEKIYVATTVLGVSAILLLSSKNEEEDVVNISTLNEALKLQKRKKPLVELGKELHDNGMFVIGDKELMESVACIRLASVTKIWRTLIPQAKRRRQGKTSFEEHREAMSQVVDMFMRYEVYKRRVVVDHGFTISEWYALLYFYQTEGKTRLFLEKFKQLQGARGSNMRKALTRLYRDGYMKTRGRTHSQVWSLTAKGDAALVDIFEKVLNK